MSVPSNPSSDSENCKTSATTQVNVYKPRAVLFGFHGVISPINWEQECILPYIKQNLSNYLKENWNNYFVMKLVNRLRKESFDQHFLFENDDSPLISDEDPNDIQDIYLQKTVIDFVKWQMDNHKGTNESSQLQKLVWMEGYNKQKLKTPVFEDVLPSLKSFREKGLKTAMFSNVDSDLCHKLFANTTKGDLTPYFDKFYGTQTGSKKDGESYRKIARDLKVSESDLLFITDFGQEAKISHETGVQSLLIIRPKNRRIRKYYLITFSSIESLQQIKFVERQQ